MRLADAYAHALFDLSDGADTQSSLGYVARLNTLLMEKGHQTLLPDILRAYQNLENSSVRRDTCVFVCAQKTDFVRYASQLKEYMKETGITQAEEVLDDTIIGGYILRSGDSVVDNSYKKRLLMLYQSAIV